MCLWSSHVSRIVKTKSKVSYNTVDPLISAIDSLFSSTNLENQNVVTVCHVWRSSSSKSSKGAGIIQNSRSLLVVDRLKLTKWRDNISIYRKVITVSSRKNYFQNVPRHLRFGTMLVIYFVVFNIWIWIESSLFVKNVRWFGETKTKWKFMWTVMHHPFICQTNTMTIFVFNYPKHVPSTHRNSFWPSCPCLATPRSISNFLDILKHILTNLEFPKFPFSKNTTIKIVTISYLLTSKLIF